MAVDPLWLQNIDYPARIDRAVFDALWTEGVMKDVDFGVTQRATPSMAVDVAAGSAVIQGDDQVFQGKYLVREQNATTNVAIDVAPGSGIRYDLVVLRVRDANAGVGTNNDALIQVVTGTPSATPSDPTLPDTAIALARVRVPAGTSAITTSLIDDLRFLATSNYASVPDNSITSGKIQNGAIVNADINNAAAIDLSKLATGALPSAITVSSSNFANQQIPSEAVFSIPGLLVVGGRLMRYYCETARVVRNVVVSVATVPSGASLVFDVNKNGSTIFTTQANRPTIAAGSNYDGSSVPNVTSVSAGDYFTIDIDQVGSTYPGYDANVKIVFG